MSLMATDQNSLPVQAFRLPVTGSTTTITLTVASTSVASAALTAGMYRIVCSAAAQLCSGAAAVAVATDLPMAANQPEYFYINAGDKVAGISTTAGATVVLTKMP